MPIKNSWKLGNIISHKAKNINLINDTKFKMYMKRETPFFFFGNPATILIKFTVPLHELVLVFS